MSVPVYPVLRDVLALPVLQAGRPRVRAGRAALDVPVRWVHVSELRDVAGTLTGGELVLSIGVALADPALDPDRYLDSLQDAGAAGLVVELGQHVQELPARLVQAARARGFPLVELARTVRFVEVTEVVHALLVNAQFQRLAFAQRVHEEFGALSAEGANAETILAKAALFAGEPVVLEDLAHRALSFATTGDAPAGALLRDWTGRSRQVPVTPHTASGGPEGWLCTPVGPRRQRWGRLVVPRRTGDDTLAMVLERAGEALTVSRLMERDALAVELEAQGGLLQDMLQNPALDEPTIRARARALGLRTGGCYAVVVAAACRPDERGDRELLDDAVQAARDSQVPAIAGLLGPGRIALVLSCRSTLDEPATVARIVDRLPLATRYSIGAAAPSTRLAVLPAALLEARHVAEAAAGFGTTQLGRVYRSSDLGIRGLLWHLRDEPRLHTFAEDQLGPLLALDTAKRNEALASLRSYLDAGGNISRFARDIHMSRPAAYARLRALERLLDVDLGAPESRLSVHLAVMVVAGPAP